MRLIHRYEHRDGFQATVCARKGRMHYARSPIDSPIFLNLQDAEDWCVDIIAENAYRQGPFAMALIERYSGPVSVLDVKPR